MFAVRSTVNQAIVRVRDREALLRDICNATVTHGKLRMAWIGMVDEDRHWIVPVAYAGATDEYLRSVRVSVLDEPEGRGPAGVAVRTNALSICNDTVNDPSMESWRVDVIRLGFRSSAAVPIRYGGQVWGAFCVHADEPNFFDTEQVKLLEQVASDISFALESLHREARRLLLDERITRINGVLLSLGVDPTENINRLTALCGEILGATGSLYTRLTDHTLITAGRWHTHDDLPSSNHPDGHMCYDLIRHGSDDLVVIPNLQDTPYVETAPCIRQYYLRTYLGKPVSFCGKRGGALCVFYAHDHLPSDIDRKIIDIISAAIGIEEARRVAVEDLCRERDRSQRYLDVSAVVMVALDTEGKVTLINRKGCELLGWTERELLGRTWFDVCVPPEMRANVMDTFRQLIAGNVEIVQYHENDVITKSGERRPFAFHNTVLRDDSGVIIGTLSSGEDLTERRRSEHEREDLYTQLLQARKMEAIGTLAGGIAHDFNNMLTSISGYAELALESLTPEHQAYNDVSQVVQAAEHAAALTRQLLLFSRRQGSRMVPVDPNAEVQNVVGMLARIIGEDIHMEVVLDPAVCPVNGDIANFQQVIMNLAVNARDAMPRGGTLSIATSNVAIKAEDCRGITEARPGDFVRIMVSDTGVGIPPEVLPRIFEPFFTTKDQGKGTGLGLSAAYGIVKQHNGWIDVSSERGKGTKVTVYLPALGTRLESESLADNEQPVRGNLRGEGTRILLVEDDAAVRAYSARVLRQNGYVVVEAGSGREAREAFEREPFGLVFSDVILPDANGFVLADELCERWPETKIILTSGYTDRIADARQYGGSRRFLHKPYSAADLLRAIKAAA